MGENLRKFKAATDSLALNGMVNERRAKFIEYDVGAGTCFGIGLLKRDDVAVQQAFMSSGTRFPTHQHDEIEYLIVHHGRLVVWVGGNQKDIGFGMSVRFNPGEPHTVEAQEDTWMIALTLPAASGYPDE